VRHIGGQQRARFGAGSRAQMMFKFIHGDLSRVRVTEHHHAQRIANEDQGDF
jgi:hypothetical protein